MPFAILGTMALQVGTAYINIRKNNKAAGELAAGQRAYEEKVAREGIERAKAEQHELYNLQRELDFKVNEDRLEIIRKSYTESLQDIALAIALKTWPLLVPPYVITNQNPIHLEDNHNNLISPTCILSTSWDASFNKHVFPILEEQLARFCLKFWNPSMPKSIKFLQQVWRDNTKNADGIIPELKAHLHTIPTLVLSPQVNKDKLSIHVYWWGLSANQNNCAGDTPQIMPINLSIPITENKNYTTEEVNTIVKEAAPQLEALISFFADLYYWNFYAYSPHFPTLCLNFKEYKEETDKIRKQYIQILEQETHTFENPKSSSHNPVSLLKLLQGIKPLLNKNEYKEELEKLYTSLSRVRKISNLSLFDESLLTYAENLKISDKDFIESFLLEYNNQQNTNNSKAADKMNNIDNLDNNKLDSIVLKNISPEVYTQKRNELIELINKIVEINGIDSAEKEKFITTQNKLRENQFNITLIGEYQGGKSTLFNALCDGREISPRGANTKTSAICITATNIANKNEQEYAIVEWKTDKNLLDTIAIAPLLGKISAEQFGVKLKENEKFNFSKYFNFNDTRHIKILLNSLDELEKEQKKITPSNREEDDKKNGNS